MSGPTSTKGRQLLADLPAFETFDAADGDRAIRQAKWGERIEEVEIEVESATDADLLGLRNALTNLTNEVGAFGLSWDEDVTGCRYCSSTTDDTHEKDCSFSVARSVLADGAEAAEQARRRIAEQARLEERERWLDVADRLYSFALAGPANDAARQACDRALSDYRALLCDLREQEQPAEQEGE